MIDQPVTRLDDYEKLGATHFIYGAKAREAYSDAGLDPRQIQLIAALGRADLFQPVREHFDATISYELYESGDIGGRTANCQGATWKSGKARPPSHLMTNCGYTRSEPFRQESMSVRPSRWG